MVVEIEQGDIYWVDLGSPKGSEPGYRRPCVVVQNDIFNQSRIATVVVCTVTSNLKRAASPGNVLLEEGEANLSKSSVVNISQILTINKTDLEQKIGTLPTEKLNLVIAGIRLLVEPRTLL